MNCNIYTRENTGTGLRCSLQEPHTQHVSDRRRCAEYDEYIKLHPSSTCFRCDDRKILQRIQGKLNDLVPLLPQDVTTFSPIKQNKTSEQRDVIMNGGVTKYVPTETSNRINHTK
jgi:hypothetical protein